MNPSSPRVTDRQLSTQQRDILVLIGAGLGTRAIADRLAVDPDALLLELAGTIRDLGAASVPEAVERAVALGLIEPPAA